MGAKGGVIQKCFPINYTKFTKTIPVLESLSNTIKTLHAVRFAILLKRNIHTGVLEPAVRISSLKWVL